MKITINTNTGEIVVQKDTIKVTKSDWKSVPITISKRRPTRVRVCEVCGKNTKNLPNHMRVHKVI